MDCPQCGHKNPSGESVCLECGNNLDNTEQKLEDLSSTTTREEISVEEELLDDSEDIELGSGVESRSAFLDLFLGKEGGTDASIITAALTGLLLTGIWYFIFPVPLFTPSYFSDIFINRGGIPYFIVWFTFTALVILLIKGIKMSAQNKAFKLNLIPPNLQSITGRNVSRLIKNITLKVPRPQSKALAYRTILGLHQFKNTGSVEQVSNILSYQAEIDLGAMEASYTMVNTYIWAVPILGFLGTVIGIGTAIGGFSGVIQEAVELEAIKGALQVVTGGLATAFDTTLLGLVAAIILMFIATPLRKREEEFLSSVETFTIENLLNMMKGKGTAGAEDESEAITSKSMAEKFKRIVENAFKGCLNDLETSFVSWKEGFSRVMERMTSQTKDISEQFTAINPVVGAFQEIMHSFTDNITKLSGDQNEMMQAFTSEIKSVQPLVSNLKTLSANLAEERKIFLDQVDSWITNFDQVGEKSVGQMRELFTSLEEDRRTFLTTLGEERNQFNSRTQEWMDNFSQSGQEIINRFDQNGQEIFNRFDQSGKEIISRFDQNGQEIISRFDQSGQEIFNRIDKNGQELVDKLEEQNQQQNQEIQSLVQRLEQQHQTFEEKVGNWLENFDSIGKNMFSATETTLQKIDDISDLFTGISAKYEESIRELSNTSERLKTSNNGLRETQDEISKLIENQEHLMGMFNKSFEQQVTSDTIFRETLVGIKDGLEAMYPPLDILSRPRKVRLIEE